jgi:hypothetical protein
VYVSLSLSCTHSHFYQGTPIFISRAVEQGKPVPVTNGRVAYVPQVPKSPECYANAHLDRIKQFPLETGGVVVDSNLKDQSQDDVWRHELDHDVESVFWLLLYWAIVVQPAEGPSGGYIKPSFWSILSQSENPQLREGFVLNLCSGRPLVNLTHLVYVPLLPLISNLAAILVVDRHWLPESDVQKSPEYICKAFQCLILQFINLNHNEDFMTCPVGKSLRQLEPVAQYQTQSSLTQQRDGSGFGKREEANSSWQNKGRLCMCYL